MQNLYVSRRRILVSMVKWQKVLVMTNCRVL